MKLTLSLNIEPISYMFQRIACTKRFSLAECSSTFARIRQFFKNLVKNSRWKVLLRQKMIMKLKKRISNSFRTTGFELNKYLNDINGNIQRRSPVSKKCTKFFLSVFHQDPNLRTPSTLETKFSDDQNRL